MGSIERENIEMLEGNRKTCDQMKWTKTKYKFMIVAEILWRNSLSKTLITVFFIIECTFLQLHHLSIWSHTHTYIVHSNAVETFLKEILKIILPN